MKGLKGAGKNERQAGLGVDFGCGLDCLHRVFVLHQNTRPESELVDHLARWNDPRIVVRKHGKNGRPQTTSKGLAR